MANLQKLIEKKRLGSALDGEWREWKGGERPVPANKMVQVRFRDDYVSHPVEAGDLWWDHRLGIGDIIAWRCA
jgi:hypothetical protein